jgi:hypothetical protein
MLAKTLFLRYLSLDSAELADSCTSAAPQQSLFKNSKSSYFLTSAYPSSTTVCRSLVSGQKEPRPLIMLGDFLPVSVTTVLFCSSARK